MCAAAGLAMLVLDPLVGLDLSAGRIASAVALLAALGLYHGWLALGVGAATSSRALAIGVPAGLAAAGYLVNGLHSMAGWLDPFRFVSPLLARRLLAAPGRRRRLGVFVVLALAVVVLAVGSILVERRDLETP